MKRTTIVAVACATLVGAFMLGGCGQEVPSEQSEEPKGFVEVQDEPYVVGRGSSSLPDISSAALERDEDSTIGNEQAAREAVGIEITEDYRDIFNHGEKGAEFQKYIVLHDTEGEGEPVNVIDSWEASGRLVAAHFVIGKDGSIWQCVPMDSIGHHAGYGDAGHNDEYGITEDGRDDMEGSTPIGDWAPDYGMNAWSIGIEMVHVGGTGYYPEEQLEALDKLIAYIDAYYGFESEIIDHKAWRSYNSDTSPEFEEYLANYQDHRTHI